MANIIRVTADYTVVVPESPANPATEEIILAVDSSSAAVAITLPAISAWGGFYNGRVVVNDVGGAASTNNITISCNASDKIDNAASYVLKQNGQTVELIMSGVNDWASVGSGANGLPAVARTASADGTGTGLIANGNVFVTVTSADANNIITLPAPIPGTIVKLLNGATGYEIRSSAPATVAINGGTGSGAESAVAANIYVVLECVSATAWIGSTFTTAGVKGVLEVAAP